MIRMQNRNSSCDCGKTTKERGSFVTKSNLKKYETRSGAQRIQQQQGDVFIEEKDDVIINTLKVSDELFLKNMEHGNISGFCNNKSFNCCKNSTIKLSNKTSINKPCDNNMVVTNGNARTLNGDALNDILFTKEIKLETLESNFVRSNLDLEESNNCSNKNENSHLVVDSRPQAVLINVESEKELREDKQNGVYERCENGECGLNDKCFKNGENSSNFHAIENSSLEVKNTDADEFVKGYLNGSICEPQQQNEELEFDIEKQVAVGEKGNCHIQEKNSDSTPSPNKKKAKRKTSLETILDLNKEFGDQFGYCSEKRRNRRPPESFSPEPTPTRRIKLENVYEHECEVQVNKSPPTNMTETTHTKEKKEKKKSGRKRKQKGPIYHYLDLYIKNKEIKEKCIKQEVVEEQLAEPLIDEASQPLIDKASEPLIAELSEPLIDELSEPLINELSEPLINELSEPLINEASIKKELVDTVLNTSENLNESFSIPFTGPTLTEPYTVIDNFTTTNLDTINLPSNGNIGIINTIAESPLKSNTRTTNFDNCHLFIEKLNPFNFEPSSPTRLKCSNATITKSPKKLLTSPSIDPLVDPCKKTRTTLDIPCGNVEVNKKKKKKSVLCKPRKRKKKPPPGYYDKDISKILGYRRNNGEQEFLVCFHNGTSNWITQRNNVSIIPPFKAFFNHPDQDLPIINRLAYFVSHRTEEEVYTPDKCYTEVLPIPDNSPIKTPIKTPTPTRINSPIQEHYSDVSSQASHNTSEVCIKSDQVCIKSDVLTDLTPVSCTHVDPLSINENIPVSCTTTVEPLSINGHTPVNCTRVDPFSINKNCKQGLIVTNSYSSGSNETLSNSDLNELCNYVMSSRHITLYPFETTKEIVFKKDDEFMHIYLKNIRKSPDDLRRIDDHLNIRSCEKLIYTLEDCVVDDSCKVVVISGIEEYFALNDVFDKLLKKPATIEGKNYEQDVSMLRYLIQTIRNFTKPIAAVIKKTATGLPASMLSLFDMVFDERGETIRKRSGISKKKKKKEDLRRKENKSHKKKIIPTNDVKLNTIDNEEDSGSYQNYLFPRLMGLTESNESQIMGEGQKINDIFGSLLTSTSYNKHLSQQLRKSLRHMKSNTKIQAKYRSRKQSLTSEEEVENVVNNPDYIYTNTVVKKTVRVDSEADIDSLSMELEREKELTRRTMSELESVLHSMEPC